MIRAEFYESQGLLTGFSFSGHSGYADAGEDIVCAAVSSAVQLTANILEELGYQPDITVGENSIECMVGKSADVSSRILNTLKVHFESILEEFPETINITISEV